MNGPDPGIMAGNGGRRPLVVGGRSSFGRFPRGQFLDSDRRELDLGRPAERLQGDPTARARRAALGSRRLMAVDQDADDRPRGDHVQVEPLTGWWGRSRRGDWPTGLVRQRQEKRSEGGGAIGPGSAVNVGAQGERCERPRTCCRNGRSVDQPGRLLPEPAEQPGLGQHHRVLGQPGPGRDFGGGSALNRE